MIVISILYMCLSVCMTNTAGNGFSHVITSACTVRTSFLLLSRKQPGEIVPCSDCIFPNSTDTHIKKKNHKQKLFFLLTFDFHLPFDFN